MNPSRHEHKGRIQLSAVAFAAAVTFALIAQPSVAQTSDAELARKAADPTQSPLSLQLYDYYTPDHYGGGSSNQLVFRPVIPYKAFGVDNIVRFTVTHNTDSPNGRSGLGDIQVLQLSIVERWGGRAAFGFSGSLPAGSNQFTNDKWTLGPAVAYVTSTSGGITFGALAQSFFSFAGNDQVRDVRQLAIQPVLAIPLGGTKTLSLGNSGVLYDMERSRWASAAPSVQFSWMTDLWGMKWRPSFEVTHEMRDLPGNPRTTFRFGTQILLPR
jgi:hypothetical protein